eukprot:m.9951 g.9951  ORF g.9951 m.9951 type:complete len:466 (+) comp4252_c0_seq1:51-1448(+)
MMARPTALLTAFLAGVTRAEIVFAPIPFGDGMILQRNAASKVWGTGAAPGSTVTLKLAPAPCATVDLESETLCGGAPRVVAQTIAGPTGNWTASLTPTPATHSATLTASDGTSSASLTDVALGDVLICGGQSNMGFGLNGARSKNQTSAQAKAALPPIRFFFMQGSGPNGGTGKTGTPLRQWFKANATNSGGSSAVCMLTAAYLYSHLGGAVPVGAIESCVGGTNVEPWTPPSGSLYVQNIVPLLPFTFSVALWDQGEADAKRTNSTWYSVEFPRMITGWRLAFETPDLAFFYVELCTEYGAELPKESDFWMAQRSALKLPRTGFATTTDVERALHPPDKQDVAARLLLEIRRVVYGEAVVSRGPEVVSSSVTNGELSIAFSNSTLVVHEGIYVTGQCGVAATGAFLTKDATGTAVPLNYTISGGSVSVKCAGATTVWVNSDMTECFLYSADSQLPAPAVEIPCV